MIDALLTIATTMLAIYALVRFTEWYFNDNDHNHRCL